MNKTVTINISGIVFHIEEDAYEKLEKYLADLKAYFSGSEGGYEILSDIEARIAELLQMNINTMKQVIVIRDVSELILTMGSPEQFAESGATEEKEKDNTLENAAQIKRRLFRDPEHKAIGGVCSGIASYFDIDITWVRLAMFLMIFFGGVSLWVYIVLWIVIPEAITTADKLAMKGEKIDINNISRYVKEEAEELKNRAQKYSSDITNKNERLSHGARNLLDTFLDFIREFFVLFAKVFLRLAGSVLLILGVCLMFSLISLIFGFSIAGYNADFNEWVDLIFLERSHYHLVMFSLILFLGIPILAMIYAGVKLLLRIKYRNRWLNLSMLFVWLFGLFSLLYIAVATGKEFSYSGKIKDRFSINHKDTLYLTTNPNHELMADWQVSDDEKTIGYLPDEMNVMNEMNNKYYLGRKLNETRILGRAHLTIEQAPGDCFELYVIKKSRGEDRRSATEKARKINYDFFQKDSLVVFNELFMAGAGEKFRLQGVEILLKVPRGKVIFLHKEMYRFINDVENITNTWDGEAVDGKWVMEKEGLKCIHCNNSNQTDTAN